MLHWNTTVVYIMSRILTLPDMMTTCMYRCVISVVICFPCSTDCSWFSSGAVIIGTSSDETGVSAAQITLIYWWIPYRVCSPPLPDIMTRRRTAEQRITTTHRRKSVIKDCEIQFTHDNSKYLYILTQSHQINAIGSKQYTYLMKLTVSIDLPARASSKFRLE